MIPTLIEIGPLPVHSFGLMLVLAFLAAWRCLALNYQRAGKDVAFAERVIFWGAISGLAGSRLFYLLSYPEQVMADPLGTIFGGAGFVYYGGFIVAIAALAYLAKREGSMSVLEFADLAAPALAIGYGVGRIGCHLSGDGDYGIASTLPWAVSYELGVVPTAPGVLVHPTPIYETIAAFAIAGLLLSYQRRGKFSRPGQIIALYLILSSVSRFLVEYVRIEPQVAAGFTQAQVISLVLAPIGMLMLMRKAAV